MEGVARSIGRNVPSFGESRLYTRFRCKTGEAVEHVCDDPARGNVGRERGIEGPRIVVVAGVDDGAAVRRATAAARNEKHETDVHREPAQEDEHELQSAVDTRSSG